MPASAVMRFNHLTLLGQNALARLRRDVLSQPESHQSFCSRAPTTLVSPIRRRGYQPLLTRTPVTADEIIAGYKQIIARTHARALKIFGATILPIKASLDGPQSVRPNAPPSITGFAPRRFRWNHRL